MSPRIAYVHLPRFPVQRRVLEEPALAGRPLVLVHEERQGLRISFVSGAAQREGIRAGMTLSAARALLPSLLDVRYELGAEQQALSSLAEGLLRFAPGFMPSAPDGLWLDASAAPLFGGEPGLADWLLTQARAAGFRARVVLASELFTARALARHGSEAQVRVQEGRAAAALSVLPLQSLEDAPEVVASLRALGLATLGELAALTPAQLIARLGAAGLRAQRLARGEDDARLLPAVLPEVVEEVRTLESPMESLEPLLFALKGLLDRISSRLRGRQQAALRLTLTLVVDPGGPHPVPLALARPTTDPRLLLDLMRNRLESVRLDGAVATLVLTVNAVCPDHGQQGVLGDAPAGDAALETVLARLTTALGPEALGSPVLVDDHRPEGAHLPGPFRPPRRESGLLAEARRDALSALRTPDWQLERPVRLLPGAGTPLDVEVGSGGELRAARVLGRRRAVLAVAGPERLGGHWWSETPFQRDYYRVHFDGLGPAWVYRSAPDGAFWLHGLFD